MNEYVKKHICVYYQCYFLSVDHVHPALGVHMVKLSGVCFRLPVYKKNLYSFVLLTQCELDFKSRL